MGVPILVLGLSRKHTSRRQEVYAQYDKARAYHEVFSSSDEDHRATCQEPLVYNFSGVRCTSE